MKKPTTHFINIILALLFGAISGGLVSVTTSAYLGDNLESLIDSKEIDIANSVYDRASLVIRDAKKVVVNQDVKIEETAASLQPVLVSAFKGDANEYYSLSEADAFGLILSNDGWVLLNGVKENNTAEIIKEYSVISYDKKVYEIDKAFLIKISGDGTVALVHLKGAVNLPVKQMVGASDLKPGTSVIVLSAEGKTLFTSITSKQRSGLLLNSDRPDIRINLAATVADDFKNALAFNLSGDFIGWLDNERELRPNYVFLPAWRAFIAKSKSVFPSLGVNYLNLSSVKVPKLKIDKGAWLKADDSSLAVTPGSAADKAGLQEGDVITRINNQELNQNNDLAEIISAYLAGETISLTYERGGEIKEINLVLGEAK